MWGEGGRRGWRGGGYARFFFRVLGQLAADIRSHMGYALCISWPSRLFACLTTALEAWLTTVLSCPARAVLCALVCYCVLVLYGSSP